MASIELIHPLGGLGVISQTYSEHVARAKANGWCWLPGNCPRGVYYYGGIDYAAPTGTPIYAAADGTVTKAATDATGYGIHVRIQHDADNLTINGHMSRLNVRTGDAVRSGEIIGYVGSTGNSSGPHDHFELRVKGVPVDPATYMCAPGPQIPNEPHTIPQLPAIPPQLLSATFPRARVIASPFVNVRKGAGTAYPLAGSISRGDTVEIMRAITAGGDIWLQIDGRGWWVAMVYGGDTLCEWVEA